MTLNPFGEISAGPGVDYFDLRSFYFGCITDLENSEVTTSEGCTISVTGFDYSDQQVPEATFAFAPTKLVDQSLVLAELPNTYVALKNVTIGIADASLLAEIGRAHV